MLKVLKASAGSGKTYRLAREYIRLLVRTDRPDAYRHVLAVTFTNKATDEMKRRILQELNQLATRPQDSPYFHSLQKELQLSPETLQKRARQQLFGILHDYSAFAVSTIDRFFQQTLRAFSREIGQFSGYQVQLDREALVSESVDRLLDGLTADDRELLDWLTRSVREDLSANGKFSLEGRLKEWADSLQDLPEGQAAFDRNRLLQLQQRCKDLAADYRKRVSAAAGAVLDTLSQLGIAPEDSKRGFLKALYKYRQADPSLPLVPPTPSFQASAADPDQWFAQGKAALRQRAQGVLDAPLEAFLACFGLPYREYVTALTLQKQLYGLGVVEELRNAFAQLQKEKNILSIDDSNVLLKRIIDGADAPFIYEKLGVRFDHFLLDEFQDTSDIQWENFRPLVFNSEASGQDSLVVGDVKQSIYRWRGSDWELLGSRLGQEFPRARQEVLDGNYRTCREIVDFNNRFFAYAAGRLDACLEQDPLAPDSVSALYADVCQQVCTRETASGSVEVCFTEDQPAEILQTLHDIRERGGKWSDVAILVRGNAEGAAIASLLVENRIPVVSDDSLFVKSSVTVRRLVSQLSQVDTPPQEDKVTAAEYLARELDMEIPTAYHSLPDLCERLLSGLQAANPACFQAEIPYIQSFMDYVQDWVGTNGNHLGAFLQAWEEASPKIAAPQTGDSVRVMTIHKSKGLEFPFVLVPYAEKVGLYKAASRWCAPQVQGTALEGEAGGFYRVSLDGLAAQSLFAADYKRERRLQAIDNINVFYVALTRARYGLKVIAALPPKDLKEPKNFSHLLYGFVGDQLSFHAGKPFDWSSRLQEPEKEKALPASYWTHPADHDSRLRFSPEAADYFGEDGSFGPEASRRIRGNVLHGILSRVRVPEDLSAAIEAAVQSGELPASMQGEASALLSARIASVEGRGWFSREATVRCEAAILAPDGAEYRPDRVVIGPDGQVDIIDYKFGKEEEKYQRQVRRYVNLYRKMGYEKVNAYLWYLEDNFINFVSG